MFEEDNLAAEQASVTSVHVGSALVGRERGAGNGRPKLDRRQRLAQAEGSQTELRPVRIGRMPKAPGLMAQSLLPEIHPTETASVSQHAADPAATADLQAGIESRRPADAETMKAIAELHEKFDAMKDSFETLEAHVSVGLAKSIAEIIRGEVSAVERQIADRYRYRTRYWLALSGFVAVVGMIVIDHFHPFFDRAAALAGY